MTGFGDAQTVSRTKQGGPGQTIVQSIMKVDVTKLPAFTKIETPGAGYSVFRINKVGQPEKSDPAGAAALQQQLTHVMAQQEAQAYVDALKAKAKVKILRPDAINSPVVDGGGDADNK